MGARQHLDERGRPGWTAGDSPARRTEPRDHEEGPSGAGRDDGLEWYVSSMGFDLRGILYPFVSCYILYPVEQAIEMFVVPLKIRVNVF